MSGVKLLLQRWWVSKYPLPDHLKVEWDRKSGPKLAIFHLPVKITAGVYEMSALGFKFNLDPASDILLVRRPLHGLGGSTHYRGPFLGAIL